MAMGRAAALALALSVFLAQLPGIATAQEAQTLKERLSDKATDDQRVDNCRVPPERRGSVPRPDCPADAVRPTPAVKTGAPAPGPR